MICTREIHGWLLPQSSVTEPFTRFSSRCCSSLGASCLGVQTGSCQLWFSRINGMNGGMKPFLWVGFQPSKIGGLSHCYIHIIGFECPITGMKICVPSLKPRSMYPAFDSWAPDFWPQAAGWFKRHDMKLNPMHPTLSNHGTLHRQFPSFRESLIQLIKEQVKKWKEQLHDHGNKM